MMTRQTFDRWQDKLIGYILVPHELLHVLACRLINQPCRYQWGDHSVKPMAKMTRNERLFVLLFPFVTCWLAALILHLLWGAALIFLIKMPLERYFFGAGPTWHVALPVVATLLIIYSGSGYGDVIQAYRLLRGQDQADDNRPEPHQQATDQQTDRYKP